MEPGSRASPPPAASRQLNCAIEAQSGPRMCCQGNPAPSRVFPSSRSPWAACVCASVIARLRVFVSVCVTAWLSVHAATHTCARAKPRACQCRDVHVGVRPSLCTGVTVQA